MSQSQKHIEIVPYNPSWPELFEVEASFIKQALGNNLVALHHVGSTAVPGLVAKPKIDMIGVVKDPGDVKEKLAAMGIDYRGEYNIPMHYGFSKRGDVDVNLHIYEEGHPEIELNLFFRDYLRTHSIIRDEYAALKQNLLKDPTSFETKDSPFTQYTLRKGDFIRKVLREAGFNHMRMLKCNDDTEWATAENFRQKYFFDKVPIKDPYKWTFNHNDHAHLILYKGVAIIGYAHLQFWSDDRAALRIIVIEQPFRSQGFGGQFLELIEKWIRINNRKSIHAEASPQALFFYKKHGYIDMPFNNPEGDETHPSDTPVGKIL